MAKSNKSQKLSLDIIRIVSIVVIVALVVLIVLTLTDVIKLCPSRAGGKAKKTKKTKKAPAKKAVAESDAVDGDTGDMLSKPLEQALHQFEKMDKGVMILGQNSCPACRMCKEFYGKNKMGDRVMFVDLMEMREKPEIAKNKFVAKALKMIGNGVPFIVLFDIKNEDVLDQMTGFDQAKAERMYEKAGGRKDLKVL
jgi:hypothetical protein